MRRNKLIFWAVYAILLSLPFITILPQVDLTLVLASPALLMNLFQRIGGLVLFTLLFWQIMIGSNMQRFVEKLGAWVFRFHIIEGITIYTFAVLHAIGFLLFNYFSGKGFDPFYIFLGFCILCENTAELLYTFGRVSFWLLSVAVFAGLFRTATPFLRIHWRKFHTLNYLVFLLVGIHGFFVGTDFRSMPFFIIGTGAYIFISLMVSRSLSLSIKKFNGLINSD